jgi:hypothetical protein
MFNEWFEELQNLGTAKNYQKHDFRTSNSWISVIFDNNFPHISELKNALQVLVDKEYF